LLTRALPLHCELLRPGTGALRPNPVGRSKIVCAPSLFPPPVKFLLLLSLLFTCSALALIQVGRGNSPVRDPGWPVGAVDVANLKSRVGWWEGPPFGGGEWQFLYRGDTLSFKEALAAFAAVHASELDLVIHNGPHENQFLKDENNSKANARVDWTFTVWVPTNWHRLYNNTNGILRTNSPNSGQLLPAPRLDVYLEPGSGIEWNKVNVPENVRVRDERASEKVK
jgi:hypothetical protein